jgi:hypothetical protein
MMSPPNDIIDDDDHHHHQPIKTLLLTGTTTLNTPSPSLLSPTLVSLPPPPSPKSPNHIPSSSIHQKKKKRRKKKSHPVFGLMRPHKPVGLMTMSILAKKGTSVAEKYTPKVTTRFPFSIMNNGKEIQATLLIERPPMATLNLKRFTTKTTTTNRERTNNDHHPHHRDPALAPFIHNLIQKYILHASQHPHN